MLKNPWPTRLSARGVSPPPERRTASRIESPGRDGPGSARRTASSDNRRCGTRPRRLADQRYENAWLFGAICPARQSRWPRAPVTGTASMQLHIEELALRGMRRPRRRPARSCRMAYHAQAQNAAQRQPDLSAGPRVRTEPGRECLAVPSSQLIVQYRLRWHRAHHHRRLLRLEQPCRPAA